MLCGYWRIGHDYRRGCWTVLGHVEHCLLHTLVGVEAGGMGSPVVSGQEWVAIHFCWLGLGASPESKVWVVEEAGVPLAGLVVRVGGVPQGWRSVGIRYSL